MTSIQKENARETAYQLRRDFKFHLAEEINLTGLLNTIESGDFCSVNKQLNELTIRYANHIKVQASANFC